MFLDVLCVGKIGHVDTFLLAKVSVKAKNLKQWITNCLSARRVSLEVRILLSAMHSMLIRG